MADRAKHSSLRPNHERCTEQCRANPVTAELAARAWGGLRSPPSLTLRCFTSLFWGRFRPAAGIFYRRISRPAGQTSVAAGLALGILLIKPQFLVAIPLVILLVVAGACSRGCSSRWQRNWFWLASTSPPP